MDGNLVLSFWQIARFASAAFIARHRTHYFIIRPP